MGKALDCVVAIGLILGTLTLGSIERIHALARTHAAYRVGDKNGELNATEELRWYAQEFDGKAPSFGQCLDYVERCKGRD